MTLDDLCLSVSQKMGMDNTAESAEREAMELWANNGVREVLLQTHCNVISLPFTLTAGVNEYTLAASILSILDFYDSDGSNVQMAQTNSADIFTRRLGGVTGPAKRWALEGANLLLIDPTPLTTSNITAYVVPAPTDMDTGSNDPESTTYGGIPKFGHRAIELWMLIQACELNRDLTTAGYYTQLFEREIGKVRMRSRQRGGRRLAPGRVGYPATVRLPHDNSQDVRWGG